MHFGTDTEFVTAPTNYWASTGLQAPSSQKGGNLESAPGAFRRETRKLHPGIRRLVSETSRNTRDHCFSFFSFVEKQVKIKQNKISRCSIKVDHCEGWKDATEYLQEHRTMPFVGFGVTNRGLTSSCTSLTDPHGGPRSWARSNKLQQISMMCGKFGIFHKYLVNTPGLGKR